MGTFKSDSVCENCGKYPHKLKKIKKGSSVLRHFYMAYIFNIDIESPCIHCGCHWCDCLICRRNYPLNYLE